MKMQVHQLWLRKQEIKIIHKRARHIDKLFWLEETSKLTVDQKLNVSTLFDNLNSCWGFKYVSSLTTRNMRVKLASSMPSLSGTFIA